MRVPLKTEQILSTGKAILRTHERKVKPAGD
jgi:hypothetical protein